MSSHGKHTPSKVLRPVATALISFICLPALRASAADQIVIGASIPLSGPLASFGGFQKWGYQHAIDAVNKAGGITISGKKMPVKLIIRDDRTNPNTTANNIETLISRDKAVALLGSCTPALVNAGALVADRHKIPMVTACDPVGAFESVHKWTYVWDLFFHEPDLAAAPFHLLADLKVATNKKVAIFHDNGPDGQVIGGKLWPTYAKKAGYQVVQNSTYPLDNTQFTSTISEAKGKGADIVLIDSVTPQAVAIRKQIAAAGYFPKVLDIEKGAEPVQFATALGNLANGVLVGGYWDPSFRFPGAKTLASEFEKETGKSSSQHIADSDAAASVLLDAIAAAGSLKPNAINKAISQTNKSYVVGPVKFDKNHASILPMVMDQWQNGKTFVVWPKAKATGKFLFPLPH